MESKEIRNDRLHIESELDGTGRKILATLQREGRIPFSELGRRVGLSAPAVAERVRRMEDVGLIAGWRAMVDRQRLGWAMTAFMRVSCPGEKYQAVRRLALDLPEVIDCHHVTGEDCFFVKIAVGSVEHLERVIDRFRDLGRTVSSVALSTIVEDKPPAISPH
jgi:Lrp/AsnC family leucine-responsive transcriptional regulator